MKNKNNIIEGGRYISKLSKKKLEFEVFGITDKEVFLWSVWSDSIPIINRRVPIDKFVRNYIKV